MYNEEFVNIILSLVGDVILSSFRSTGVRTNNDGTTKFLPSTFLSTNHRTADQLKFQCFDVIGWKKCRWSKFPSYRRTLVLRKKLRWSQLEKKIYGISLISIRGNYSLTNFQKCKNLNTVFPGIVSSLEYFPHPRVRKLFKFSLH